MQAHELGSRDKLVTIGIDTISDYYEIAKKSLMCDEKYFFYLKIEHGYV